MRSIHKINPRSIARGKTYCGLNGASPQRHPLTTQYWNEVTCEECKQAPAFQTWKSLPFAAKTARILSVSKSARWV